MTTRRTMVGLFLALAAGALVLEPATSPTLRSQSGSARADTNQRIAQGYGGQPLSFEVNRGQTNSKVKFLTRGRGYALFLTREEAVLALRPAASSGAREAGPPARGAVLRMGLAGTNQQRRLHGREQLRGKVNYLRGSDPRSWQVGIPTYAKVLSREVYPGIDLVYYGRRGQLEFDFLLEPGAEPGKIGLSFQGADELQLSPHGDLLLGLSGSEVRLQKPRIYQEAGGGRRAIPGGYVIKGADEVGFRLGSYDASRPLVIDPVLSYSTYLGGSADEQGNVIVVDRDRNAYLTGFTFSSDFPTTSDVIDSTANGDQDAFVTKLNRTGSALLYSTYLGGSGLDSGETIAIDRKSNAYVTGITQSSDLPTTPRALDTSLGGTEDGYVAKLNRNGSALLYSTYLGGSDEDGGLGVAVDDDSNAYVAGFTRSGDFPTTARAFDSILGGGEDAFVAKLNRNGSALSYSTYLGGSGDEEAGSIAIDDDDDADAYVTGFTASSDFPTARAFDSTLGGTEDAFVTKLNRNGSGLRYSTYLGGSGGESLPFGIAVDDDANAYVTSRTFSSDFPTTARAFDSSLGGTEDAFVTKLDRNGSALRYSTYLGGSGEERSFSVAVDEDSHAYVTGRTLSGDFPTARAFDWSLGGTQDAFVTTLNAKGSALLFSTYLGGNDTDQGVGIAVDSSPNAYVSGATGSSDFPTTPRAFDTSLAGTGTQDAFLVKITRLDGH